VNDNAWRVVGTNTSKIIKMSCLWVLGGKVWCLEFGFFCDGPGTGLLECGGSVGVQNTIPETHITLFDIDIKLFVLLKIYNSYLL